ncbi:MAG: serine hydrolase domain-containing protein [Acidimicrobiales bacterium]
MSISSGLIQIDTWPVDMVAAGVTGPAATLGDHGKVGGACGLASVTKLLTAYAVLVAVEEGTMDLDEAAGPDGSTVRHLLSHASGLGPNGDVLGAPGRRRIYSNAGYEVLGIELAARSGISFSEYLGEAVLSPLHMTRTCVDGSPAFSGVGTIQDLLAFGRELLAPRLISPETLSSATTVNFAGLDGVLPGFGRMKPNDWGLGFELRSNKSPHWTGTRNSLKTFGHFGASGTFLWVDPEVRLACVCLTNREFGEWTFDRWPALSDAVIGGR